MTHYTYGMGYKEQLERRRKEIQQQKDTLLNQSTLPERIEIWFKGLSQEDQKRRWTMLEFREIFNETPQALGKSLFFLGWSRKRLWLDAAPCARYWVKS